MLEKEHLIKLANTSMPFGKYKGRMLVDLPESYLLWFSREGFPRGELGLLLQLALEIEINGLNDMVRVLKNADS